VRHYLKILLLLFLFSTFILAQKKSNLTVVEAQDKYAVENITVSNGLHDNYIFDVLQDHLGFLWLAGDNGLQKYDGYSFTLYPFDSSDITTQNALRLYEDKNNTLWVQMTEGLMKYRRERNDFSIFYFVNSDNDSIPYEVTAMAEDKDSVLWVWIHDKGLYKVNSQNNTFISHDKINKWFRDIKKPRILKEGSRKGFYETTVTFPAGHYGLKLQYKYLIKRNDGILEWEHNAKPGSEYTNREVILTGDTLSLPVVPFDSIIGKEQKNSNIINKTDVKPTVIKFNLSLNNIENPLSEADVIQIRGDKFPLMWDENVVVNSMIYDSQNMLWIGFGSSGLVEYNLETGAFRTLFENHLISGSISNNTIYAAIQDQDGSLWFASHRGLNRYDYAKTSFENYFIDTENKGNYINHIYRMADDGYGNIWTISQQFKGVGHYNTLKKEFLLYSKGMDAWISSVTTDRSGIVWLGNWYQGIYKLDPAVKKFSTFSIKKDKKDILEGKRILAVYKDKAGEIWMGGELDGLYRYNRKTGKTSVYKIKGGNFDSWIENYIFDIFQDSKGNFWIGTQAGLCYFNSKTGSFTHVQQPSSIHIGLGKTAKINEDTLGRIWLVTRNGFLVQLEPNTYKTEFHPLNYSQESPNFIYPTLIKDPRGFLWIGIAADQSAGGVFKFELSKKKLSVVKQLEKFNITSLCIDDGILWCGTIGQGLIRYNTRADTKSFVRVADGLLSNEIMGLEQDDFGNLWMSTPGGLSKYDPQTRSFSHYFKEDGFFTNEFTNRAHHQSKNGEMIFGSLHGVVTFHPDDIKNSEYEPPIVLTDFKIQNETVSVDQNSPLKKHISVIDEIELAHDENDITFTFASLDFKHPERIKYSFYLENFEENWREPGLERSAYYTNLDPGEYVFNVKGTNRDGIWNEEGISLSIIIYPPWWQTWWAYSTYIVLILATLYFLRRYELHRQKLKNELALEHKQTEKLQEIDRMKSRFFANISHEFRTPLTLILGPIERILKKTSEDDTKKQAGSIKQNASRLLALINQLLDLSKLEAGELKLKASCGNIVSFIKGITLSFESIAERKDIALVVNTTNEEIEMYFDKDKMAKILSNLLTNAFKFTGEGGEIVVSITETDTKSVKIIVKDTGIGIPEEEIPKLFDRFYQVDSSQTREHEGTGIGLAHTKELVELHHGRINVDSKIDEWTEFTIELLLGRNHLNDDEIVEPGEVMQKEIIIDEDKNLLTTTRVQTEISNNFADDKTQILVVEDNEDVRTYIVDSLSEEHRITEAENGVEGRRIAEEINPDLIISDIMMPKMDGNELTRQLKNNEKTSHIPIILLTAKSEQESKIKGLETGADDYLTKPFDTRELLVRIKNLVEQRKKLQEKFRHEISVNPSEITVTSIDEQLLQRAISAVENNISETGFDTTMMAKEVGVSRTLLHTKLKALTGQSTGEFIRTLRLKRAAQLFQKGYGNVTQVAYDVGFQNLSYFAKSFRNQFGKSPSSYASQNKNDAVQ
jgi:signal transduction histidine kinase/ligand-binding sensor domain-containing protein/DNA-binding response OmpR family regulator